MILGFGIVKIFMNRRAIDMKNDRRAGVSPVRTFMEKASFWTGGTPVLPIFSQGRRKA
jgi:hypothetical protein